MDEDREITGVCLDIRVLIDNAKKIAARQKREDDLMLNFFYALNDPNEEVLFGAIKEDES